MAATLIASSALAATAAGPLPAGKPAGVKQAQEEDNTVWWVVGVGVVAAGIALVASGDSDDAPGAGTVTPPTTTTTTSSTKAATTST
jgi:hypothetical protein